MLATDAIKELVVKSEAPQRYAEDRPWGRFEQFVQNEPCSVKIITVNPGEELSLQSHTKRSEWWIILDDAMDVEIDGARKTVKRNEEVFIPVGGKHRAIGLDKACRWLEIAFGEFDEMDIVRYADKYGRDADHSIVSH